LYQVFCGELTADIESSAFDSPHAFQEVDFLELPVTWIQYHLQQQYVDCIIFAISIEQNMHLPVPGFGAIDFQINCGVCQT
jgi:hypothetical protein